METRSEPRTDAWAQHRQRMVEEHMIARGIRNDRVLEVMRRLPREMFVPAFLREFTYDDRPLLIGYEQTISQPYIVALMTEALELKGSEKVLEVGTGSGFQTAALAELAKEVFSVERIAELSLRASQVLDHRGYENIHLRVGDGALGWREEAPFDAIIVTAGANLLPTAFLEQLGEGGRLVIPLGPRGEQILHRYTRRGADSDDEELTRVAFVPLISNASIC